MHIKYPSEFSLKVIRNEGAGNDVKRVRIVVPTIVRPSKPFTVKIALLDETGLAVVNYKGKLKITLPEETLIIEVPFMKGKPALARIEKVVITKEGFFRFSVRMNGKMFYSNPIWCSREYEPNIYWGDPHIHTALSNCVVRCSRSIFFCFTAARYLSCLDWASAADHVSNGRCDQGKWKEGVAASNLYDDPPDFVTLPAYEASLKAYCGGDNNVYMNKFPSAFVDQYETGNTKTLCDKLQEITKDENLDFFVVPHHTSRSGKHGELSEEIYPGEKYMPVMEIHSKWGCSEYINNPIPLKEFHNGPAYAVDFLRKGWKLGFIGGSDSHATLTFTSGNKIEPPHLDRAPGLTAVRTHSLTRENIFYAIKQRNCYATTGERIFIDFKINGYSMGDTVILTEKIPRKISVIALGESTINKIEIIRNGRIIHRFEPNDWRFTGEYTDKDSLENIRISSTDHQDFVYYYIRVECVNSSFGWATPIWVQRARSSASANGREVRTQLDVS